MMVQLQGWWRYETQRSYQCTSDRTAQRETDDSVSAVDTKTEKIILDNLRATRKGKTTILIAHRISTIQNMDKILFIDDGKVVAFGSHQELIDSCKDYANMVELQRLEDEYGGESHD